MKPTNRNQVFLLLTTKGTEAEVAIYEAIRAATQHIGDTFILYHHQAQQLPGQLEKVKHFTFTNNTLSQLNYIPIGFRVVPGNTHFPLFDFISKNEEYDYYWVIEDDVRFNGDWKYFFDTFAVLDKDFITSHIRTSAEEPDWSWWHYLAHPYRVIPFENRLRSFNPIYRLSRQAVAFLGEALSSYWCGHYEVLMATLLKEAGYSLMDFGGTGEFVSPGYENKFYVSNSPDPGGELKDGTMRYRPVFWVIGNEENKLYHPVKL